MNDQIRIIFYGLICSRTINSISFYVLALKAKLKEFSLTLTQNGPLAPSFLTVCVDKSAAQQYGLPDDAMSLVIHAYGDATEDTCENFGPHFNPYGVIIFYFLFLFYLAKKEKNNHRNHNSFMNCLLN